MLREEYAIYNIPPIILEDPTLYTNIPPKEFGIKYKPKRKRK